MDSFGLNVCVCVCVFWWQYNDPADGDHGAEEFSGTAPPHTHHLWSAVFRFRRARVHVRLALHLHLTPAAVTACGHVR